MGCDHARRAEDPRPDNDADDHCQAVAKLEGAAELSQLLSLSNGSEYLLLGSVSVWREICRVPYGMYGLILAEPEAGLPKVDKVLWEEPDCILFQRRRRVSRGRQGDSCGPNLLSSSHVIGEI